MKLKVEFVDNTWYGKTVEVLDVYITELCGQSAMNILFEQDEDDQHKSNNFVVIHKRNDLNYTLKTTDSAMSVSTFASDKFDWYYVDKEYLLEVLEGETNEYQTHLSSLLWRIHRVLEYLQGWFCLHNHRGVL